MSGWIKLHRGFRDCPALIPSKNFSDVEAWVWLLENAAWRGITRTNGKGEAITLKPGQIHVSVRSLASAFGWDKKRVDRFLARLEAAKMCRQSRGQSGNVLTIENWAKYQSSGTAEGTDTGTDEGQLGDTQEEGKEGKEENNTTATPLADGDEGSPPEQLNLDGIDSKPAYRFVGTHLKITEADFQNWKSKYHGIPDFEATLFSVDQWVATLAPKARSNPYGAVHSRLLNAHNDWLRKAAANPKPRSSQPTAFQMPC